jgi:hypothetical protein
MLVIIPPPKPLPTFGGLPSQKTLYKLKLVRTPNLNVFSCEKENTAVNAINVITGTILFIEEG